MKCKNCGAFNEDYLEYCEVCAAPLTDEEPATPGIVKTGMQDPNRFVSEEEAPVWDFAKGPEWPEPEFDAATVSEDDVPFAFIAAKQNERAIKTAQSAPAPKYRISEQGSRPLDETVEAERRGKGREPYEDYVSVPMTKPRKAAPAIKSPKPPRPPKAPKEFAAVNRKQRTRSKTSFGGGVNFVKLGIIGGAVLVVLVIALICAISIKKNYEGSVSAFVGSIFGSNPITKTPTVEESLDANGNAAYLITVYCKKSCSVRFRTADGGVDQTEPATEGFVAFRVPLSVWMPTTPVDGETVNITPDLTVITKGGEEIPVEIAPIVISVPTLTLTLTTPETEELNTSSREIPIAGMVSDPTAEVYVGDKAMAQDAAGNFTGTYQLEGTGTFTINIEARKAGYQIARKTLTVECTDDGSSAIVLTSTFDNRTTSSTKKVDGSVEAGSTLTVSGATLSEDVQITNTGVFSFTVSLPEVGVYPITITATKDGSSSSRTIYIIRSPVEADFSATAHQMDYTRIVATQGELEQAYMYTGTVEEIIQSSPYMLVKFKLEDGNYVIVEYYYKYIANEVGKKYKLWGEPHGMYTDGTTPMMLTWFVYSAE